MIYSIYILRSKLSGKYYVGHSNDTQRRLEEHNSKENMGFTKRYQPWELIFEYPMSDDRNSAILVEKFIKNQKSKKFIEKLILDIEVIQNIKLRFC